MCCQTKHMPFTSQILPDSKNSLKSGSIQSTECWATRFKKRSNAALRLSTNCDCKLIDVLDPFALSVEGVEVIFNFVVPAKIRQLSNCVYIIYVCF